MSRRSLFVALFAVAALVLPSLANAQATRTWVSGVGDDVNPCSRTAPCKTFAGAISKTASGGIISVLDPAGYGAVTITKPITLTGPPGYGHILTGGVQGIIINITTANPRPVIIRNIDISGASATTLGTNGINFIQGGTLRLHNVNIDSFSSVGLLVQAPNARIYSNNLLLTDVTTGIQINPGASIGASFKHTDIANGSNGVAVSGAGTAVAFDDCSITNDSSNGLSASSSSFVQLRSCDFYHHGTAITSNAATVRVSNSIITNNFTGVSAVNGGSVLSFGNNILADNFSGNTFTGTFSPQ